MGWIWIGRSYGKLFILFCFTFVLSCKLALTFPLFRRFLRSLGYRLGMCSVLALWVAWDCVWGLVEDGHSTIGGRTAFPVFRASGGLVLVHWFWGISVYVWNRFRINYI